MAGDKKRKRQSQPPLSPHLPPPLQIQSPETFPRPTPQFFSDIQPHPRRPQFFHPYERRSEDRGFPAFDSAPGERGYAVPPRADIHSKVNSEFFHPYERRSDRGFPAFDSALDERGYAVPALTTDIQPHPRRQEFFHPYKRRSDRGFPAFDSALDERGYAVRAPTTDIHPRRQEFFHPYERRSYKGFSAFDSALDERGYAVPAPTTDIHPLRQEFFHPYDRRSDRVFPAFDSALDERVYAVPSPTIDIHPRRQEFFHPYERSSDRGFPAFDSAPDERGYAVPLTTDIHSKVNTIATKVLLKNAKDGFKKGNFVCSPMLFESLLSMVAWGAKGETLQELLSFLGVENVDEILSKTPSLKLFSRLLSPDINQDINKEGGGGPDITIGNGIWVDQRFPLVPSFNEILKNIYKVEDSSADFRQPLIAAGKINSWVLEKTKGLVPEIIAPDDIRYDTVMILANAVYFKGFWENAFKAEWTKEKKFHLENVETVLVPFMTSNKDYFYGTANGFKILRAPYKCGGNSERYSMYFFLPEEKGRFQSLIENFDSQSGLFSEHFHLRETSFAELWVPKFKFSYNFEASNIMEEMGLKLPFDKQNKEFSGIVDLPDSWPLCVSKLVQKACIEVDEEGTVAVAVTYARYGCGFGGSMSPPRPSFVADHPFLFMIREETSRAVLFIGAVLDPQERN